MLLVCVEQEGGRERANETHMHNMDGDAYLLKVDDRIIAAATAAVKCIRWRFFFAAYFRSVVNKL